MADQTIQIIARRLIAARGARRQSEIAKEAGIPQMTLSRYESGERKQVDILTLTRIADALGVSLDYLVGRKDSTSIELMAAAVV